jgi:hypothetical protein
VCQGGTDWSACGEGGEVCDYCAWYEDCFSQVCDLDPASLWAVDVAEVHVDPSTTWDVSPDDPKPDVFVELSSLTKSSTTKTIDDNYDPVFNEYMFIQTAQNLMQTDALQFKIKDSDLWFHDLICEATDRFYQFELTSGSSTIPYPCANVKSIKFKLY